MNVSKHSKIFSFGSSEKQEGKGLTSFLSRSQDLGRLSTYFDVISDTCHWRLT
jgi:hypothetical protein